MAGLWYFILLYVIMVRLLAFPFFLKIKKIILIGK